MGEEISKLNGVRILGIGDIRKRGTTKEGKQKFDACLKRKCPAALIIKDAVSKDLFMYAKLLLDDGSSITITNKPYIERDRVCINLSVRLAPIWEKLWLANKPVLIEFVLKRNADYFDTKLAEALAQSRNYAKTGRGDPS